MKRGDLVEVNSLWMFEGNTRLAIFWDEQIPKEYGEYVTYDYDCTVFLDGKIVPWHRDDLVLLQEAE